MFLVSVHTGQILKIPTQVRLHNIFLDDQFYSLFNSPCRCESRDSIHRKRPVTLIPLEGVPKMQTNVGHGFSIFPIFACLVAKGCVYLPV